MRKNNLWYILTFAAGALAGVAGTWQYFKGKYEQIANEEIDSIMELYNKERKEEPINEETKMRQESEQISRENGYTNHSNIEEEEVSEDMKEPYIISSNDFDMNDYNIESLTYYADGILVDDWDQEVDMKVTVGTDFMNYFVDNCVYVRNDEKELDYEIIKSDERYIDLYEGVNNGSVR